MWESPQRSGDVSRIRCVPRVSVPKLCIRASAPHAPVFRGSRNTIDMQGFDRAGLLALRVCSGKRFRSPPFVFAADFCASGLRFCDGIAAQAGWRRSMRVSKACFGDAVRASSRRAAPVVIPASFPRKRAAPAPFSAFASIVRPMRVKGCGMQGKSLVMLLVVLYASAFLAGFNENLVNMALMSIMGEYGVDSVAVQWLVTG